MTVVTAGVHLSVVGGTMFKIVGLMHRKGVHVRAQTDGFGLVSNP